MGEPAVAKDLSARNEKIVRDFLHAWENKDFNGVVGALSPDIFYHNIPQEPIVDIDDAGKITSWRDYFDLQFWVDNGGPPL